MKKLLSLLALFCALGLTVGCASETKDAKDKGKETPAGEPKTPEKLKDMAAPAPGQGKPKEDEKAKEDDNN